MPAKATRPVYLVSNVILLFHYSISISTLKTFSVWCFPLLASWVFIQIWVREEFHLIFKSGLWLLCQTFSSTNSLAFQVQQTLTHSLTTTHRSYFTSQFNRYQEIFVTNNYCALDSLDQLPHLWTFQLIFDVD